MKVFTILLSIIFPIVVTYGFAFWVSHNERISLVMSFSVGVVSLLNLLRVSLKHRKNDIYSDNRWYLLWSTLVYVLAGLFISWVIR